MEMIFLKDWHIKYMAQYSILLAFIFWPCSILVPDQGLNTWPLYWDHGIINYWTARKVPLSAFLCRVASSFLIVCKAHDTTERLNWLTESSWRGFPGSSADKKSAYNAGDPSSIPGLGRSPGEGNPLQYSDLENSVDSPWGCKESNTTEHTLT